MFAVVFEVRPAEGKKDEYLGLAQHLKPILESIDGFVAVDRFASRRREGWMLSLSIWRDEKSVVRWRSEGEHHKVQLRSRADVFSDYHLRVGEVTADSQGDVVEQRLDETEIGAAKAIGLTEMGPEKSRSAAESIEAAADHLGLDLADEALVDHDLFESVYTPGKLLMLTSWTTASAAQGWMLPEDAASHHRQMRNVRDYGLFDRREAPQFCPVIHRKPGPAAPII